MKKSIFCLLSFLSIIFSCRQHETSYFKNSLDLSPKEEKEENKSLFLDRVEGLCNALHYDNTISMVLMGELAAQPKAGKNISIFTRLMSKIFALKKEFQNEKLTSLLDSSKKAKTRLNDFYDGLFATPQSISAINRSNYPAEIYTLMSFIFIDYLKNMQSLYHNQEELKVPQSYLAKLEKKAGEIKIIANLCLNPSKDNQIEFGNLTIADNYFSADEAEYENEIFKNLSDKKLDDENSFKIDYFRIVKAHFFPIEELLNEGLSYADSLVKEAQNTLTQTSNKKEVALIKINKEALPNNFARFTQGYFYEKRKKRDDGILDEISALINAEIARLERSQS